MRRSVSARVGQPHDGGRTGKKSDSHAAAEALQAAPGDCKCLDARGLRAIKGNLLRMLRAPSPERPSPERPLPIGRPHRAVPIGPQCGPQIGAVVGHWPRFLSELPFAESDSRGRVGSLASRSLRSEKPGGQRRRGQRSLGDGNMSGINLMQTRDQRRNQAPLTGSIRP